LFLITVGVYVVVFLMSGRVGLNYTHNITQDHRSQGGIATRGFDPPGKNISKLQIHYVDCRVFYVGSRVSFLLVRA
jgi:hypothetical protein